MTHTLVSLISIVIGIIGGNTAGYFFNKYSFGLVGNTIVGVFGSVFLIKSLGRLGFSPKFIVHAGNVDFFLFTLNAVVSFLGGAFGLLFIYKLKKKMNS